MSPEEIDRMLRPVQLKDLRLMCRARGLNPAGGKEQMSDRIKQHMFATGNFSCAVPSESGAVDGPPVVAPQGYQQYTPSGGSGAYAYPPPQNQGNPMVPPGGYSQVQLGNGYDSSPYGAPPPQYSSSPAPPSQGGPAFGMNSSDTRSGGSNSNNYSRPGGAQNMGNFLTDRPSSRVSNPPGGKSQISFGDYTPSFQPQQQQQQQQQQYSPAPAQMTNGYATAPSGRLAYGTPPPGYGAPPPQASSSPYAYGSNSFSGSGRGGSDVMANNYSRPGGAQNMGNFITDRPSSKVSNPPGGRSQISFG